MERGRLFYHYLEDEELTCERDGESIEAEPRFKVCVIGDMERIEIRNLSVKDLTALRDGLTAILDNLPPSRPSKLEHPESGAG
jgi:hypothetical protein